MKWRIATWASAGFLVAGYWAVYFATEPAMLFVEPEIIILVRLTCPIALLSHYPPSLFWALIANTATYSVIGVIAEISRHNGGVVMRPPRRSPKATSNL
jgi:hypothetical protein